MRFYTSDTHLEHENIIKYSNRPFKDVDHMNEMIIRNWNNVIAPEDIVFHLGDVALGPWEKWHNLLTRLNGYKILVVGNHDRIFKGQKERMQERFAPLYNEWFDEVHENIPHLELDCGVDVSLSHFPYDGDHTKEERYSEFRLPDEGEVLIHGHTHLNQIVSNSKKGSLQIHVGQDAWNYTPVSEDQICNLLQAL